MITITTNKIVITIVTSKFMIGIIPVHNKISTRCQANSPGGWKIWRVENLNSFPS